MDDRDEGIDSELKLELVLEDESILDEDGSDEDMARLDDWSELLDSVTKSAISQTEVLTMINKLPFDIELEISEDIDGKLDDWSELRDS